MIRSDCVNDNDPQPEPKRTVLQILASCPALNPSAGNIFFRMDFGILPHFIHFRFGETG